MGIVYVAEDTATNRPAAIKLPLGTFVDDPAARKQFMREAEAWTELVHPHIVHAFDVRDDRTTDYRPVIVMDYCDGGSLHDRLDGGGGLSLPDALDIAIQVCWGMEFAHERGYLHRDLKPGNVLLTKDGKALVTDLGLSRQVSAEELGLSPGQLSGADARWLASVSQAGGTPIYMPPEQWVGKAAKQSDIYAFGVMLYEMLCGRWPFAARDYRELQALHERTAARDPRELNPVIPAGLANLVLACLAKRPQDRPSAFGLVADAVSTAYRQLTRHDYASRRVRPSETDISCADKKARAWALIRLGNGCGLRGDLDDAARHYDKALALFRELGDKTGLSGTLGNQALILRARGDLEGAMRLLKQAEQICLELGDKAGLSATLGNQALILKARGDLDGAMQLHKQAEQICRELGDKAGLSATLGNQALILWARGDLDGAMQLQDQAEQICRELGDKAGLSRTLGNHAVILWARGDLDGAMQLHKQKEQICRELGDKAGLSATLGNQALILKARGDLDGAMQLHKQKEQICRELGDKADLHVSLGNQGTILWARGDLDGAMQLLKQQEQICRELGDKAGLSRTLGNQAVILRARGDLDGAMQLYKQAEQICRELGTTEGLARSLASQALLLIKMGRIRDALPMAEEAYRLATRCQLSLAAWVKSVLDHIRSRLPA